MKVLLRIVLGLAALLLVAAVVAWFLLDSIVRTAVEKGGAHATGTTVVLDKADFALTHGVIDLGGLSIANPAGFRDEPFVRAGTIHAAWENGTIFSDALVIDEIALDDVEVNLQRAGGRTNFGKILEHLKSLGGEAGGGTGEPPDTGSKRTLVVKRIVITNVKAAVHLDGVPLSGGSVALTIPRIDLGEFRSDGTTREILGQLTSTLVQALLHSTLDAGNAVLPKEILGDLKGNLQDLEARAKDKLKDVRQGIDDVKDLFKKKN